MAKQGVKDIRVDFVEAIGKTENLKTIRSICYDLEKRTMRSRLTQSSINNMLEEGYNKIISLLGDDAFEYFLPTMFMKEVGVSKYFEMLKIGIKNFETIKTAVGYYEKQKSTLPSKISKAEKDGEIADVYRYKQLFMAYTNPSYFWKLYGKEFDIIDGKVEQNPAEERKPLLLSRFEAENATCLYAVVHNVDFEGLMIYDDNERDKYEEEQLLKEISKEEIELLIWYRIRSTTTSTTTSPESYWDSVEYGKGSSIFSDKSIHFESFLEGDMLASNVSTSNKNFVYGEITYYSGSPITRYGWFYNYAENYG